jgi:hypothetical protein
MGCNQDDDHRANTPRPGDDRRFEHGGFLLLRSGIGAEAVIKQLSGIRRPFPAWQNGRITLSCSELRRWKFFPWHAYIFIV